MTRQISDPEVTLLAALAGTLRADYVDEEDAWEGSPFAWIKTRPSRQVGAIGEKLVAGWCAAKGLDVARAPDSECDRVVGGRRVEIKFSTWWKAGGYKFQQFRNQNYELAICLGLSPFAAHTWVIPKHVLLRHVIGHTPQHGGRAGSDTAWLHVSPDSPPDWLQSFGGSLSEAFQVLMRLTPR
jgi:hypothetical protein